MVNEIPVRTLEDGRLSVDPPPVTLADLASEAPDTPRYAVLRLWFSIQWWDAPAIVSAYTRVVSQTLEPTRILRAWQLRRSAIVGERPRGIETTRNGDFRVVTFTRESRTAPPAGESVTMVRQRGRWRILHDTMLEDALAAHAQSLGSQGQAAPSNAAARRAVEARRRFRDLAAEASTRAP